jgi:hypothetical protein
VHLLLLSSASLLLFPTHILLLRHLVLSTGYPMCRLVMSCGNLIMWLTCIGRSWTWTEGAGIVCVVWYWRHIWFMWGLLVIEVTAWYILGMLGLLVSGSTLMIRIDNTTIWGSRWCFLKFLVQRWGNYWRLIVLVITGIRWCWFRFWCVLLIIVRNLTRWLLRLARAFMNINAWSLQTVATYLFAWRSLG